MRNVGLKNLLRYTLCMVLFIACGVHAKVVQSSNAALLGKKNISKKANVSNWRDAVSHRTLFSNLPNKSSSLGDAIFDDAALQQSGLVGTRANWDFANACVATDNIDPLGGIFFIDGSGCGGNITVNGVVHVRACTADMTALVLSDTRLVAGTPDAAIIIEAALGRTITFNVQNDLGFAASATDPLLLVLRGPGTIIFTMTDGTTLSFGDDTSLGAEGVNGYIIMEDPDLAGATPTVIIQRLSNASAAPVDIEIGQNSFLTYAACTNILDDPTESARLILDPSNLSTGRMVLTIHDGGNLNVAGRLMVEGEDGTPCPLGDVCAAPFDFALDNFDRSTLAGLAAVFGMVGTSGATPIIAGRMLIINENETAFDFQADPWCTLGTRSSDDGVGCFDGTQYGFVLGANGVLAIDADQTFDYVGLGCNVCPTPVVSICESVTPLPATCEESPTCAIPQAVPFAARVKPRNYSALIVDGFNNPDPEADVPNASIIMCECTAMVFRSGIDCCCVVEQGRDDADCSIEFTVPTNKLTPGSGEIVFDVEGLLDVVSVDVLPGCGVAAPVCELAPDPCGIPQQAWSAKIELLSLHVCRTGCKLLVDHTCCDAANFPMRDFITNIDETLVRYNKGQFFINNRVNLQGIALVHTDENHVVIGKNDVLSESTYVGGESWTFCGNAERPAIAFYNSAFFVHTDVALTGLDLLVPNDNSDMLGHSGFAQFICEEALVRQVSPDPVPCCDNTSAFIFFQNGNLVDGGMGRQMILGTRVGAVACDGCTIISADAHLDVKQENPCVADPEDVLHRLLLQTWPNNGCVNEGLFNSEVAPPLADIATQPSLHCIYLGNSSNISIGADDADLAIMGEANLTLAQLIVQGNFFAFSTRGGSQASPALSSATGQGGIFVDFNGQFCVVPTARVAMGDMVTQSHNAEINLPAGQVRFSPQLGIENWQLNLADPDLVVVDCNDIAQVVVVPQGQHLSNYALNWLLTTKNYVGDDPIPGFLPYVVTCYNPCTSPVVTAANVQYLPTILGTVDRLQIRGSTLGNEAYVAIRGCGEVRELVNVVGCNCGELPAAVVVLGDSGSVGLGDVNLGANGVTIIADGPNVRVRLTSDITIDNVASILKGPNFCSGCNLTTDECVIRFESDCCSSVRVTQSGILDLSSFDANNQVVEFGGNIRLILEPGATIAWGGQDPETEGGVLRFVDQAQLIVESYDCAESIFQNAEDPTVSLSDPFRAKLVGNGQLILDGCSSLIIAPNAFLGVETLTAAPIEQACGIQNSCQVLLTDITVTIRDQASFLVGNGCRQPGGAFQVGNTTDQVGSEVSFSLIFNGQDASFVVGSQGFVGFGVGIVTKLGAVNDWLVNTLFNLGEVSLILPNGTFTHDRIYTGSDLRASLMAFSQGTSAAPAVYNFVVVQDEDEAEANISTTTIRGGGNIILVEATGGVNISPNVTDVNGEITAGRLNVGILASLPLMPQEDLGVPFSGTADQLVALIRARDTNDYENNAQAGLANVARSHNHYRVLVDYVVGTAPDASTIVRDEIADVRGPGGSTNTMLQAVNIGAARVLLDPNNPLIINQIRILD